MAMRYKQTVNQASRLVEIGKALLEDRSECS